MGKHAKEQLHTGFRNSGRIAGYGMSEDYYGDEPIDRGGYYGGGCTLPHDNVIYKRNEWEKLNGPVIVVKEANNDVLYLPALKEEARNDSKQCASVLEEAGIE